MYSSLLNMNALIFVSCLVLTVFFLIYAYIVSRIMSFSIEYNNLDYQIFQLYSCLPANIYPPSFLKLIADISALFIEFQISVQKRSSNQKKKIEKKSARFVNELAHIYYQPLRIRVSLLSSFIFSTISS